MNIKKTQYWVGTLALAALTACGAEVDMESQITEIEREAQAQEAEVEATNLATDELRRQVIAAAVGTKMADRVLRPIERSAMIVLEQALENGNVVQFLEPMDGVIAIAEKGPNPLTLQLKVLEQNLTASQLFQSIFPNDAAPEELLALDGRAEEMAPVYRKLEAIKDDHRDLHVKRFDASSFEEELEGVSTPELDVPSGIGQVRQALTANECIAMSWCDDSGYDWAVTQRNRTGISTITHSDANPTMGIGCCQTGQITYRVRYQPWYSWKTWFTHDLPAGWWVGQWRLRTDVDYDFEGKLYNFNAGDSASQCAFGND